MEMESAAAVELGWPNLRLVETIYEENSGDDDDDDVSSSSSAASPSSPPPPSSPSATSLRSRVKLWSLNNGVETDVVLHVQGSTFHLHKDPLARCSGYLKRQLTESSEITISPALKLTPHVFTLIADHCYGGHPFITPFNVAPLLLASELLEMKDDVDGVDQGLRRKTEAYFCRTVAVDCEYAAAVLRSCVALLPEVETRTGVVGRCVEALSVKREVAAGDVSDWFDGVQELTGEEFGLVVGGLHRRLTGGHDVLYRIIDFYFKEKGGKMTEEEGTKICNYIDCTNLSSSVLMHAVQNPRMPIRFVVQAMFIEQLNTRRSVFSAAQTLKSHNHRHHHHHQIKQPSVDTSVTLGAILERDAALRQVAHLRATMDSTGSRIQSLEEEINDMRKILNKSNMGQVKSESFRFSSERKVERGQRGSVSSGAFRVVERENESDYAGDSESPKRFGKRVMNGLKSAFRVSVLGRARVETKMEKKRN